MAPLNVGFVGYGFATRCFHLPYILPNTDLNVYAFLQRAEAPKDKESGKGKHCTVDYPNAKHYRTAEEFFNDGNIDLVIVCTHHDTHATFAEQALTSGKHVVVEKPFTPTSAEADRLIALSKEKGKMLTVFQNRRYDSDFRTLHNIASKGVFGKLIDVTIHYDVDFPPWIQSMSTTKPYNPGDGIMFGLGSHSVDQALLLIGATPTSVTGFYRALRGSESEVDDSFIIILQFGGELKNLIATVTTSVISPMERSLKYLIRGYDGSFIKYGEDQQETQIMNGMQSTDEKFGVEDPSIHGKLCTKDIFDEKYQSFDDRTQRYIGIIPSMKGSYTKYYEDVVDAIKQGKEPFVTAQQSRNGIRVIELARQSAQEGRSISWS